jgi:hypothetical protein
MKALAYLLLTSLIGPLIARADQSDVVIYGTTPAGIAATKGGLSVLPTLGVRLNHEAGPATVLDAPLAARWQELVRDLGLPADHLPKGMIKPAIRPTLLELKSPTSTCS